MLSLFFLCVPPCCHDFFCSLCSLLVVTIFFLFSVLLTLVATMRIDLRKNAFDVQTLLKNIGVDEKTKIKKSAAPAVLTCTLTEFDHLFRSTSGKEYFVVATEDFAALLRTLEKTPPGIFKFSFYGTPDDDSEHRFEITHNITWSLPDKLSMGEFVLFVLRTGVFASEKMVWKWLGSEIPMNDPQTPGMIFESMWMSDIDYLCKSEMNKKCHQFPVSAFIDFIKAQPGLLSQSELLRMFIHHSEITFFCSGRIGVYNVNDLLRLDVVAMKMLMEAIESDCLALCFGKNPWNVPSMTKERFLVLQNKKLLKNGQGSKRRNPDVEDVCLAAFELIEAIESSLEKFQGNTVVHRDWLHKLMKANTQEDRERIDDILNYLTNKAKVLTVVSGHNYTLTSLYELENCICESVRTINNGRGPKRAAVNFSELLVDGRPPCEQQVECLKMCSKQRVVFLQGSGGTGKTETVKYLAKIYAKEEAMMCAFQNRNVSQLRRIFPLAFTAHTWMRIHYESCPMSPSWREKQIENEKKNEKKKIVPPSECSLARARLICIDEAGMLDSELFSKVLSTIALCCRNLELLLIMGDFDQLPPISRGRPFVPMFEFGKDHEMSCEYTEVLRVGDAKIIAENNALIAKGRFDEIDWDGVHFVHFNAYPSLAEKVVGVLEEFGLKRDDSLVVTRTNYVADTLSAAISEYYQGDEDYSVPRVGDKVSFNHNWPEREVWNNELFVLEGMKDVPASLIPRRYTSSDLGDVYEQIDNSMCVTRGDSPSNVKGSIRLLKCVIVDSSDHDVKYFVYDRWAHANLSVRHCITVNRAQGGEVDTVIFVIADDSQYEDRRRVFTAFTRGKKRVVVVGSMESLKMAVARSPPPSRTALKFLLDEHAL